MSESRSYLQQIIDGSTQAIFVLDEHCRLLDCNRLFEQWCPNLFGIQAERGQSLLEGVEIEERLFWSKAFERAIGGKSFELAREVETKDGPLQLELGFRTMDEPKGLVACVTDLSKWHRHKTALEKAIQSRDLMMSVLGHDLRTPVFQLNGLLYLLRNLPSGIEPDRFDSYIDEIDTNLNTLGDAIENLLQWANTCKDEHLLARQSICARAILNKVLTLMRPIALSKGIEIQVDSAQSLRLNADPNMLAFIMRNLLGNAVKFSPSGTSIRVRQSLRSGRFEFQVSDNGVGMKPEVISKVMSGLSASSQVGTNGEKGFGLGLRLCQDFVTVHGGEMNFTAAEGGGLIVTVGIPQEVAESV